MCRRSLVDSGTPEQQQQRRRQQQQQDGRVEEAASSHSAAGGAAAHAAPLSQDDAAVLNKLVGVLMKDGKKARARRILVDAMHIIKQQLARDASGGGGSADR
jgi:Ribosomal protein S7p/S5e